MSIIDTLTQRNREFAEHQFSVTTSLMPSLQTMIISCVDPRVDPAHILGIGLNEAAVIRNVGGRITPGTLQMMAMLQTLNPTPAAAPAAEFNIVVLHHTDCGITHMVEKPDMLATYFGIDKAELAANSVSDPWASVAVDVALLKANPLLPATWIVHGMVYDVATGRVEVSPNTLE